ADDQCAGTAISDVYGGASASLSITFFKSAVRSVADWIFATGSDQRQPGCRLGARHSRLGLDLQRRLVRGGRATQKLPRHALCSTPTPLPITAFFPIGK